MPPTRRIADAVATTRARASLAGTGPGLTAAQTASHPDATGISIVDATAPSSLSPSQEFAVGVSVSISAAPATPVDTSQDFCNLGFPQVGFQTAVTADTLGDSDTETACARAPTFYDEAFGQAFESEFRLSLTAPETPGDYSVDVTVSGGTSDLLMAQETLPFTVVDNSPDPAPDPSPDPAPDPEPAPPSPGLLARLIEYLETVVTRAIDTFEDIVLAFRDLLVGIGETVYDALLRLAEWIGDNPILLAVLATVAFYVAPRAVDFVFNNFTPAGWIDRIVSSVL